MDIGKTICKFFSELLNFSYYSITVLTLYYNIEIFIEI